MTKMAKLSVVIPSAKQCVVNAVFYSAYGYVEDGKATVGIEEWVVRSVKHAKRSPLDKRLGVEAPLTAYMIRKTPYTWVRKTKGKDKTMVWAVKINASDRQSFVVGSALPAGIFTTKLQAFKWQLGFTESTLKRCKASMDDPTISDEDRQEWEEEIKSEQKLLTLIKGMITKERN